MTTSILQVENLVKNYGDVQAVRGVSFSVEEGEVFGLLGPNGAGKTTIVKIFTTLLLPTSGTARVLGLDAVKDQWALRSHQLAAAARDAGRFDDEIVPVTERPELRRDESINARLTAEDLASKKPAFRKGGTVTGGNSSPLNDGAAALLLMSQDAVRRAGVTPLARYVGSAAAGVHPDYMGIGPVPAMNRALGRAGWQLDEVDLIEVNEAFAAQSVAVVDELKADPDRVNVNGGAIAIGHPLGCSGARIVTTLLHEMRRRGAARGAASMCIGVGQGIASLWEAA